MFAQNCTFTNAIGEYMTSVVSIDIDAQNAFSPYCPDELPIHDAPAIVAELNAQARLASLRVMSKDAHPANPVWLGDNGAPLALPHADKTWRAHAVVGTHGFELMQGLPHPSEYDFLVYKGVEKDMHPYGACYHDLNETISTGLLEWLSAKNASVVLVGGLATDFCVYASVRQLLGHNWQVWLNLGAMRGIDTHTSQQAINELCQMGAHAFANADAIAHALACLPNGK